MPFGTQSWNLKSFPFNPVVNCLCSVEARTPQCFMVATSAQSPCSREWLQRHWLLRKCGTVNRLIDTNLCTKPSQKTCRRWNVEIWTCAAWNGKLDESPASEEVQQMALEIKCKNPRPLKMRSSHLWRKPINENGADELTSGCSFFHPISNGRIEFGSPPQCNHCTACNNF